MDAQHYSDIGTSFSVAAKSISVAEHPLVAEICWSSTSHSSLRKVDPKELLQICLPAPLPLGFYRQEHLSFHFLLQGSS